MLALAVVAILVAGLAVSMSVAFRARRSAVEGLGTVRAARLAMDAIGRDLRSALPPTPQTTGNNSSAIVLIGSFVGVGTPGGPGGPLTSGSPGAPGSPTAPLGASLGSAKVGQSSIGSNSTPAQDSLGSGVTFYNTADPSRQMDGAGDVEEVTFRLVSEASLQLSAAGGSPMANGFNSGTAAPTLPAPPSATDEGVLVRSVRRNLLALTPETPVDQVLCRHVRAFGLRYSSDGVNYSETWDSTTAETPLPMAVEVTLQITRTDVTVKAGTPAPSYNLVRVFSLPCYAAPASTTP